MRAVPTSSEPLSHLSTGHYLKNLAMILAYLRAAYISPANNPDDHPLCKQLPGVTRRRGFSGPLKNRERESYDSRSIPRGGTQWKNTSA